MRWAYDDNTRDLFGKGIHRDILIVPHATNVIKVAGGPPEITSKVPEFKWNETGGKDHTGQYEPVKENGHYVYQDVEWTITNDDIVKEKFKYSSSLNSDDNLTFSSCNAAMIQFTIRNKKEYVQDEETQEYYWKPEIPNLFKYEYTQKDGNGNTQKIVGELMSNACIKAYMYFNGDSSTLMYLGMFKVEEDKLIDNGYNRQITAYDFLAWFREIDIFYWYKHLFEGINKLGNDYEDYTNDTNSKEKHTQAEWDKNYIREPKEKWTIGEALNDLIDHFAAYDMTVFEEEVVNEQTGEKKNVMKLGATSTNPNDYGRDDYEEGNGYTGLGMPIILDSNVMTKGAKPYMPTEPGPNEKEQYGYMNILELEFYQDPKIMKSESLSAGKLLEDIGLLAGRYPYIRTDDFVDGDYIDPKTITPTEEEKHPSKYICYEKCILTFKPLPSAENDKNVDKVPESMFDNHDIVKGFQHDYYQVQDITVMKFELDDGTEIKYSKLNKSQLVAEQKSELQTFTITNNMFANYLVTKSDDDDVKKMLDKYKVIREKLFGKDSTAGNISPDALFNQGYNNIRNHIYTPYQLTTFADPVRDVGDRIKIDFTDMITGEQSHFYTYILEREMNGIQAMMDTYTAKGTMKNPLFTNYQTSSKAKSGGDTGQTSADLDIMTPFDLIEYMRNCGYRMLDEPSECSAVFAKGTEQDDGGETHIFNNLSANPYYAPDEYYPKDGDTTNPYKHCTDWGADYAYYEDVTANIGDYVQNLNYDSSDNPDPAVPGFNDSPLYVYTLNSDWKYVGGRFNNVGCNFIHNCAGDSELTLANGDNFEGSTCDEVIIKPKDGNTIYRSHIKNTNFYEYDVNPREEDEYYEASEVFTTTSATIKVTPGDAISALIPYNPSNPDLDYGIYQYPGIWVKGSEYPKLNLPITIKSKPYVQLKWSDPPDIDDWEPTPAAWEGTVIVRKEDSAPLHRWDGEKVVLNKTRDKYKTKAYKDEDIKMGRTYYYGFFPYYTADDSDPEHLIRYYTFTKVIKVETGDNSIASTIDSIDVNGNTATIKYTLSQPDSASFASVKIYGKIGSNPSCDETDDIVVDADPEAITKDIPNLEYDSTYYFCLVTVDSNDEELSSNVVSVFTGESPIPPEYDYITRAGTYNVRVIDANHGKHYYDLTEVPFIWNRSQLSNPFNKNLPFTLYYPGEKFYNWYYSTITGIRFYDTATINLTKESNDSYTASYTGFNYKQGISLNNGYNYVNSHGWTFESEIGAYLYVSDWSEQTQPVTMTTSFNSLSGALTYIEEHFRHVNVYVDGICWVTAT